MGEYDATTGAAINANFIAGLNGPGAIVFAASVPEPSTFVLAGMGMGILGVPLIRRNGKIDAGDVTECRDSRGSMTNLTADGNGDGSIDAGDTSLLGFTWSRRLVRQ